ncbi:MAG: hypothetical protein P3W94_003435, partial [Paracoccus sp. (in: a-proteobacteria)]|nr:hypothetical protein [Paracoccus sp. (in: a-proteobacteria)]
PRLCGRLIFVNSCLAGTPREIAPRAVFDHVIHLTTDQVHRLREPSGAPIRMQSPVRFTDAGTLREQPAGPSGKRQTRPDA